MRGSYGGFRVSSRGRLWTDIGNWVFFFLLQRLGERRGFEVLNCKERLGCRERERERKRVLRTDEEESVRE